MINLSTLPSSPSYQLNPDLLGASYDVIATAFQWPVEVSMQQCTLIKGLPAGCWGVKGELTNLLIFSHVSVSFYLFDMLNPTDHQPERQGIFLIDQQQTPAITPMALLNALAYSSSATALLPSLEVLTALSFAQPYLLFSTVDYTHPNYSTVPFPPLQDKAAPQGFLNAIKPSLTYGFNALLDTQLASSLALPLPANAPAGTAPAVVNVAHVLQGLGLSALNTTPFSCNASLAENAQGNVLNLWHELSANATFDGVTLELTGIGTAFELSQDEVQIPNFIIKGKATFDSLSLDVEGYVSPSNHVFSLAFTQLPTFAELEKLFTGSSLQTLIGSSMPSGIIDTLGALYVKVLSFVVDVSGTPTVSNMEVVITTESAIRFDSKVSVTPQFKVQIAYPFDNTSRSINTEVLGLSTIAGVSLGVIVASSTADDAATMLIAEMLLGTGVSTAPFIKDWLHGTNMYVPDITLLDVEFTAFKAGEVVSMSFEIEVSSNWKIDGTKVGFDGMSMNVAMQKQANKWEVTQATARGDIQIGPVHFYIAGQYAVPNKSWYFEAGSQPDYPLLLGEWLSTLADDLQLPDSSLISKELSGLNIDTCYLSYGHGKNMSSDFQLVLGISDTTGSFHGLPLENIIINVQHSQGTYFHLSATSSANASLSSFMGDINTGYGLGIDLPAAITTANVPITSLNVTYDSVKGEMDLQVDAAISLADLFVDIGLLSAANKNQLTSSSSSIGLTFVSDSTGDQKASDIKLSMVVGAGIKLDSLLDLSGDLPADFNPEFTKIELAFDLSKERHGSQSSSDTKILFNLYFDNHFDGPATQGETAQTAAPCVLSGMHSKSTINGKTYAAFAGHLYSQTGDTLNIDFGASFPLDIQIKNIFIAKISSSDASGNASGFTVYGSDINIDAHFDLSSLPVVGGFLTEAKFSFNALRFTYLKPSTSSANGISAKQLAVINDFLQEINVAPLVTAQSSVNNNNGDKANFPSGYSLQGSLVLGDNAMTIPLHTAFAPAEAGNTGNGNTGHENTGNGSSYSSPLTASPVGKKFGPVTIDSVGLGMRDGGLGLKFTGGLTLGPVEFDLIGFEITSPITHFDPDITLNGLGVDIHKGALALEGLMMKGDIDIPEMNYSTGQVTTESVKAYSGALALQYKHYNLDALGSYTQLPDGSATMFLYAFLGAPLGGPPAFFVTGIAAGFGYNRTFNLPAPTEISSFPLIQPVISTPPAGTSSQSNAADDFAAMNKDFLPKEGAFWGAVGLRVESFKMVESFVLLDVQFGDTLEVDLIGISNMTFPTPAEGDATHALAKIIIGIEARMRPEQGVLTIDGAFQPGTYILDPSVHVTGGFGMLSVFTEQTSGSYKGAKEGDFIFSIGGYPSHYAVASYYPRPQRLGFNWQVSPIQSIKGSAYFAIVPEAMMAGGALENLYNIGGPLDIKASFILGADFIIYWKPYHYSADVSLEIDVCASLNVDCWLFSIHLDFNMDLGADLQVWGPPFAGKGVLTVHSIVTFSVDVSFGDVVPAPIPISWPEFCNSFLPVTDNILTAAVGSGLLSTVEKTVDGTKVKVDVVNPKEVSVACHTVFPLKSVATSTKVAVDGTLSTGFGIAPMAKTSNDIQSSLTVTVTKNGINSEADFTYTVLTRNLPSAMWQAADTGGTLPDTKGKGLISNLVCGVEIKPKPQGAEFPFTIIEPEEEIINTPYAVAVSAFTYGSSNFSIMANSGA